MQGAGFDADAHVKIEIMATGKRVTVALQPADTPAALAERVRAEQRPPLHAEPNTCSLRSMAGQEVTALVAGRSYSLVFTPRASGLVAGTVAGAFSGGAAAAGGAAAGAAPAAAAAAARHAMSLAPSHRQGVGGGAAEDNDWAETGFEDVEEAYKEQGRAKQALNAERLKKQKRPQGGRGGQGGDE